MEKGQSSEKLGGGKSTERNTHVTWLVANPMAFGREPGPTSPRDVRLPLGLTYHEWRELFFVVLDVDSRQLQLSIETGRPIMEFDREIPGYPMLSRINNVYGDAVFARDEVHLLELECLRMLSSVSSPVASQGLRKLLAICAEAEKLDLSLYLMCD